MSIILHEVNGVQIGQRKTDGFINATAMCAAHGKRVNDWLKTKDTFELFLTLANDLGHEVNYEYIRNLDVSTLSASDYAKIFPDLIFVKRGSPENGGGTWLYSDLAMQNAQWCSKPFAIQVSRWVRELSTTGSVQLTGAPIKQTSLAAELQTLNQLADLRDRLQLEFTEYERDVIKRHLISLIAPELKSKPRKPQIVAEEAMPSNPSEHHLLDFAEEVGLVAGEACESVYVGEIWERLKGWYLTKGIISSDRNGSLSWIEKPPVKGRLIKGSNQVTTMICALLPYAKKGRKDVKGMKIMGLRFN